MNEIEPPKPRSKTKEQKLIERIEVLEKQLVGLQARIDALVEAMKEVLRIGEQEQLMREIRSMR